MPATRTIARAGRTSEKTSAPRAASRAEKFDMDYTHVKHDLRRIGILAGGFIAVLVILSFFIN